MSIGEFAPLTEIKAVIELRSETAADRIHEFWAAAENEHSARRALAAYLVDLVNGKR
jgi:hypothetical protein